MTLRSNVYSNFRSLIALALFAFVPTAGYPQNAARMSLDQAGKLADAMKHDPVYAGQLIEPMGAQVDPNFYGFQMIQETPEAANFQFSLVNVNRFNGDVWTEVGETCELYKNKQLTALQNEMKKQLRIVIAGNARAHSLKPMECKR